jgi:hypothetical protein
MNKEELTNEWKQYTHTSVVSRYREGWHGAWDALVAAITMKPRFTILENVTVSIWAKAGSSGPEAYHLAIEVKK